MHVRGKRNIGSAGSAYAARCGASCKRLALGRRDACILLHRANRAHVTYDDLTCGFMLPAPVETRHHILSARVGRGVLESLSRAGELVCFIGAFMC